MDAVSVIALSMGAAWASGINLYATLFMLGYMATTGNITLPAELEVLANPMVMTAAGFMYCVEFFADKIPGVDSAWDSIHTFIRIPAGAMLASSAIGDVTPAIELTTALLGGALAAGTHTTKAGTRLLINTSPEPVSNWTASIGEDLIVIGGLWTALNHPVLFIIGLVIFILFMIWVLPRLWRLLKLLFRKVGSWLGFCAAPSPSEVQSTSLTNTRDEQFKP
tara:strand:+ start:96 stop:761 length:666 start_codon:yes stop_codon:yes gene_type:complete